MSEEFIDSAIAIGEAAVSNQRMQYKLSDFVYDAQQEAFWCIKDMILYGADSVDAMVPKSSWEVDVITDGRSGKQKEVPIKPSKSIARIERDSIVESSTWWPGEQRIVRNVLVTPEGDVPSEGKRIFNTYRPPSEQIGDPAYAGLWVEHLRSLWPEYYEQLLDYFAHLVQRPQEKANFAIAIVGEQGIGKDAALQPVRAAVGEWNCKEIDPDNLFSGFQPWKESVLLIINEARPSKDEHHATSMYNILKTLTAAPPNWLPMNQKYMKERFVRNLMRVIITFNELSSLYIPENDRRMFVLLSPRKTNWADPGYFERLFNFYAAGGYAHVRSFLMARDISKFDPNTLPEKTDAWHTIVSSWGTGEMDILEMALAELGRPDVIFGKELLDTSVGSFDHGNEMMSLLKSSRRLLFKMEREGYSVIRKGDDEIGAREWKFKNDGCIFRSKLAFARRDAFENRQSAYAAILETGKLIAENKGKRPGNKVVQLHKGARAS